jgi:Protein of unknown function (DUF3617)
MARWVHPLQYERTASHCSRCAAEAGPLDVFLFSAFLARHKVGQCRAHSARGNGELMHRTRNWIVVSLGLFALALLAWAQARKAGLWEMTTTTTWQQSPVPDGMANSLTAPTTRTTQVCLTRQQIDKYNAIIPSMNGGCHVTNVIKKTNGMTADMICAGRMSGKGTLESSATDSEHATGKMHFVGSIQLGAASKPIEWTANSTSVYKSPDCGSVKPMVVPEN